MKTKEKGFQVEKVKVESAFTEEELEQLVKWQQEWQGGVKIENYQFDFKDGITTLDINFGESNPSIGYLVSCLYVVGTQAKKIIKMIKDWEKKVDDTLDVVGINFLEKETQDFFMKQIEDNKLFNRAFIKIMYEILNGR